MSDLQNLTPANTYKGLLQVGDYTNGVDSTVRSVLDGEGTASALAISTTKVGIGTTSPTQELEVNGDIVSTTLTASGAVTAGSVSTSGAVGAGSIDVGGNVVADEYALDQVGSSSSAVAIHAPATNELAIRTNTAERVRIDSSGNVGIGTDNPQELLNLAGQNNGEISVNTVIRLTDTDTVVANPQVIGRVEFESKSSTDPGVVAKIDVLSTATNNNLSNGNILFYTGENASGLSESMRIDKAGNVGIGTTSPSAPLDVTSTTGGVIMPRMNTSQRTAISASNGEMDTIQIYINSTDTLTELGQHFTKNYEYEKNYRIN